MTTFQKVTANWMQFKKEHSTHFKLPPRGEKFLGKEVIMPSRWHGMRNRKGSTGMLLAAYTVWAQTASYQVSAVKERDVSCLYRWDSCIQVPRGVGKWTNVDPSSAPREPRGTPVTGKKMVRIVAVVHANRAFLWNSWPWNWMSGSSPLMPSLRRFSAMACCAHHVYSECQVISTRWFSAVLQSLFGTV